MGIAYLHIKCITVLFFGLYKLELLPTISDAVCQKSLTTVTVTWNIPLMLNFKINVAWNMTDRIYRRFSDSLAISMSYAEIRLRICGKINDNCFSLTVFL